MSLSAAEQHKLVQLKYEYATLAFQWSMIKLDMALDRALQTRRAELEYAYRPDQPRVPAGRPDGGQWTDGDDADTPAINDPPIEEVYPELLILPFLRIPRILNAWRLWALRRRESREWSLGKFKSRKRWANQMESRNWTPEDITETIRNGEKIEVPNMPRKDDPTATATRYEYNGRYVVRDDQTGEILQISGPRHIPTELP
jgi:Colicin E5 ribonuclease domain